MQYYTIHINGTISFDSYQTEAGDFKELKDRHLRTIREFFNSRHFLGKDDEILIDFHTLNATVHDVT